MKGRVTLRPLEIEDTCNIVRWRNSKEVKKNLFSQEDITEEQHIRYFNDFVRQNRCIQFIIVVNDEDNSKDIGTIFIKNIDIANKKGEFGIFIGEEKARGLGYSKYAIQEVLKFAFINLELNRVYLSVLNNNKIAIHSYLSQGFLIEGRLRQDYYRNGTFYDVIVMSILKDEWLNKSFVDETWGGGTV